jgi:hypothetical protein
MDFEAAHPFPAAPTTLSSSAGSALKQRSKRKQSRRKDLTTIDRRGRVYRRIRELEMLFLSTFEGAGVPLTPMRRMRIAEAAQLKTLAEKARGDTLRGGSGSLDDVIRVERRADAAVRAIGLPSDAPREPSLAAAPTAPAQDLSQLSNSQLDSLYTLLAEAKG